MTLQPHSVLLDKNVVRRVYERRVRLALGKPPTLLQAEAANAYSRLCVLANRLYITEQTANILQLRSPIFVAAILADTRTLKKGRYLRRWARRLRELGFSPEDAIVVAHGSFGIDVELQNVGVDAIVTGDIRLASHFDTKHIEIEQRFEDMVLNLPEPYNRSSLPTVMATAAVLTIT